MSNSKPIIYGREDGFRFNEYNDEFENGKKCFSLKINGVETKSSTHFIEGVLMPDGRIFESKDMGHHDQLVVAVVDMFYPKIKAEMIKLKFMKEVFDEYHEEGYVFKIISRDLYKDFNLVYLSENFGIKKYGKLTRLQKLRLSRLYSRDYLKDLVSSQRFLEFTQSNDEDELKFDFDEK